MRGLGHPAGPGQNVVLSSCLSDFDSVLTILDATGREVGYNDDNQWICHENYTGAAFVVSSSAGILGLGLILFLACVAGHLTQTPPPRHTHMHTIYSTVVSTIHSTCRVLFHQRRKIYPSPFCAWLSLLPRHSGLIFDQFTRVMRLCDGPPTPYAKPAGRSAFRRLYRMLTGACNPTTRVVPVLCPLLWVQACASASAPTPPAGATARGRRWTAATTTVTTTTAVMAAAATPTTTISP